MNPPRRPQWWNRLREHEDDSVEVVPDHSMRSDATAVHLRQKPTDYRASVLPANYTSPPDRTHTLEAPQGTDTDRKWRQPLVMHAATRRPSGNAGGGGARPRPGGIGAALRNLGRK